MPQSLPKDFDPYHRWLGIPPAEQPPNHYRLLGLDLFECDHDVIAIAADRQMVHLKTYQIGKHSALSQKLLSEVSKARACLLHDGRRLQYDQQLRQTAAIAPSPLPPVARAPAFEPLPVTPRSHALPPIQSPTNAPLVQIATGQERPGARALGRKKQPLKWGPVTASAEFLKIALGGAGGLAIAIVLLWVGLGSDPFGLFEPVAETLGDTQETEARGVALPGKIVLDWPEAHRSNATLQLNGRQVLLPGGALSITPTSVVMEVELGVHNLVIPRADGDPLKHTVLVASESPMRLAVTRPQSVATGSQGVVAHYFRDREFQNLAMERVDPNIHFLWDEDAPAEGIATDNFSVRWEGFIKAPRPGRYTLAVDADDHLQVWIDGQEVLNVNCRQQSVEIDLTDQPHGIRVELVEDSKWAHAVLTWSLPGVYARQAIPAEALFTERALAERTAVPETVMRPAPSVRPEDIPASQPVDLLALIDPARDAKRGIWWFDNGSLLCSRRLQEPHGDGKRCTLDIPFTVPNTEYRLTAEVERCVGRDSLKICLATERGRPYVSIDNNPREGWRGGLYGVPGDRRHPGPKLHRGERHTVECEVRRSGIKVSLDGTTLYEWNGDMAELPETGEASPFVLVGYDTIFRIHKLTWVPLTPPLQPGQPLAAVKMPESTGGLTFTGQGMAVVPTLNYDGKSPLTLEAYVTLTRIEGDQAVLSTWSQGKGAGVMLYRGEWSFMVGGAMHSSSTPNSRRPVKGKRIHLVGVYDGQRNAALYIDGKLVQRTTVLGDPIFAKEPFALGAIGHGQGPSLPFLHGIIHEARVSFVQRYTGEFAPPPRLVADEQTAAAWQFNEASGQTILDSSGNEHHGMISGATRGGEKAGNQTDRSDDGTPPPGRGLGDLLDVKNLSDLQLRIPETIQELKRYEGRNVGHRATLIKHYGGSPASEEAVALALEWLRKTQLPDGSWSFDQRTDGASSGGGAAANAQNGATALALLAMLGAGQTHLEGKYKETVGRGLYYLIKHGSLTPQGHSFHDPDGNMYSHGLATMALCEAYAMSNDAGLYKPMRAAVSYTLYAQDPRGGGWRYQPHQSGDTSVTGWQVASLYAYAETSPKPEDKRLLNKAGLGANAFLNSVQERAGAAYGYDEPGHALGTTAVGLTSRIYLGWTLNNPALQEGIAILDRAGPDLENLYYTYYGTQVARHVGGDMWQRWNTRLRDPLVKQQVRTGPAQGSWYLGPDSNTVKEGGRLFCTATAALVLESYYRDIPQIASD